MKVLIAGSSGLVGKHLVRQLGDEGCDVTRLVRQIATDGQIQWNPSKLELDGFEARRIRCRRTSWRRKHCGRSLESGQKRRIRDSRVDSTTLLAGRLAELNQKPQVFLCASAIGIYGSGVMKFSRNRVGRGATSWQTSARNGNPQPRSQVTLESVSSIFVRGLFWTRMEARFPRCSRHSSWGWRDRRKRQTILELRCAG